MKKQLAVLLAATLSVSAASTAFAAGGSVDVDNDVASPILSYVVPTIPAFTLDAFGKLDAADVGTQVASGDFKFINKSDVAVSLKVKVKAAPKTGVTLVDSPSAVNVDDYSNTDKEIYLEAVAAASVADDSAASTAATVANQADYAFDILTQPTAATAAFTDGDATAGTPAKFVVDLTGATGKLSDESVTAGATSGVAEVAIVSGGVDIIKFATASGNAITPAAAAATGKEIGESINGETCAYKGQNFTVTAATGDEAKLTIAYADNTKFAFEANTAFTVEVRKPTGIEGTPAFTTTNVATFDDNGADTTGKITLSTADTAMLFGLSKSTYVKPTADQEDVTFSSVNYSANSEGATSICLMGKVNPVADWQKEDIKVSLSYDINPMSPDMYTAAGTEKTDAALAGVGLFAIPPTTGTVAGVVAGTDAKKTEAITSYWNGDQTALLIPVKLPTDVPKPVTITTIQYRADSNSTTGAMLSSTNKTIDENGIITIAPVAANLTNIKTKGVIVVITFSDGKKVTLNLNA